MECVYNIELDNNKLSHYDFLLQKFKNWKQFKREIKLSSILEGKRIQYDLDDVTGLNGYAGRIHKSKDICFMIKSLSFIINGDSIDILKIKITPSNNYLGEVVKSLIENSFDLKIKQFVNNDEVIFFYIDIPDKKEIINSNLS
jgi:hypothetical protein